MINFKSWCKSQILQTGPVTKGFLVTSVNQKIEMISQVRNSHELSKFLLPFTWPLFEPTCAYSTLTRAQANVCLIISLGNPSDAMSNMDDKMNKNKDSAQHKYDLDKYFPIHR